MRKHRSILIDVPVVAYKTWCILLMYPEDEGSMNNMDSAFDDIKKKYPYVKTNRHVR